MSARLALLAAAFIPFAAAHAQMQSSLDATAQMIMSSQQSQVPGGECAATSPCQSQGLIPITFQPGDVVLTGSVTDSAGNTWSLASDSCNENAPSGWWSGLSLNGVQQWCGYGVALRDVNGDVWYEEAKGSGWKDLTAEVAAGDLTGAMTGPYVADPGQGTTEAAAVASPAQAASPVQTCPGVTQGLANGAITPGEGTFQAGGNTYSIDATNGDVAAINGAPINQWAYQTSQLVLGSDGAIYGQSNAANNNGQWFQLSSDGASWQPLSGVPAALIPTGPGGNTLTSTAAATGAPQACPVQPASTCVQAGPTTPDATALTGAVTALQTDAPGMEQPLSSDQIVAADAQLAQGQPICSSSSTTTTTGQ